MYRRKQAAALEIAGDDRGDVSPGVAFRRPAGQEVRQRNLHRPHVALVDGNVENGPRRTRAGSRQRTGANQQTATAYFGERSTVSHEIALPCRKIVKHLLCVESEVYFFPLFIMFRPQHRVRLPDEYRAHRAFAPGVTCRTTHPGAHVTPDW